MSTATPEGFAIPEPVPLKDRLMGLMYILALCLALSVLWAMAAAASAESKITYYPPLEEELQAMAAQAAAR